MGQGYSKNHLEVLQKSWFVTPAAEVTIPEMEEEENLPLSELVIRLSEAGQPHTEADVELALTKDKQVESWGFLTDEKIINEVKEEHCVTPEEERSDEDEPSPQLCPTPPFAEFRKSIDVTELYLSYEDGPNSDEMYSLIQRIQTIVLANPPKQKQINIKDYFKPSLKNDLIF